MLFNSPITIYININVAQQLQRSNSTLIYILFLLLFIFLLTLIGYTFIEVFKHLRHDLYNYSSIKQ